MQGSRSSSITTTLTRVRRGALAACTLVAMAACAGDRAVVEPGGVANASTASASATEGRANVYVLEETTPGSILMAVDDSASPDQRYVVNASELTAKLQSVYGDVGDLDFLIVLPNRPLSSHSALVAHRSISGIGSCNPCTNMVSPNIKHVASLSLYPTWSMRDQMGLDPMLDFNVFQTVALHELGHYWLAYVENFGTEYYGHYTNTLDLFYGDSSFADPLALAHWIVNGSSETCVFANNGTATPRFSDLSLYLMGFIPPQDVAPITQHLFAPIPGYATYNALGPMCGQPYAFTGQRVVTIDDIIALHGVRSPSHLESQKDFRAMFVVVHPAGDVPPSGFLKYASTFADSLPASWASAMRGLSSIKIVPYVRTSELQP